MNPSAPNDRRLAASTHRGRYPVPVLVIAGFLGSGKTTLLNHLLANTAGARIGVLVNDFGSINIDALLVTGQTDGAVDLGNGCMCCSVDADGLGEALGRLATPSADLDAIVVEASGIAEPRALIRMVNAVADPRVRYGGLIYVVDAAAIFEIRAASPELDRHLQIADLVVVNKSDLVSDAQLRQVIEYVTEYNPTAPHVTTREARVDPGMLFEVAPRTPPTDDRPRQLTLDELLRDERRAKEPAEHGHLHDRYSSVSLEIDEPLDPRALAGFLERPPSGCYRIKGVVHFESSGPETKYVVHSVGGFVRADEQGWGTQTPSSRLVVIGAALDTDAVRVAMEGLVADVGDERAGAPDEHGILSITRYLPPDPDAVTDP